MRPSSVVTFLLWVSVLMWGGVPRAFASEEIARCSDLIVGEAHDVPTARGEDTDTTTDVRFGTLTGALIGSAPWRFTVALDGEVSPTGSSPRPFGTSQLLRGGHMIRSPCRWSWQIEAARDGRLPAAELASLDRHFATCSDCARERHVLDTLARKLSDGESVPIDELAMRRLRQATLEQADAALIGAAAPGRASARFGVAGLLFGLLGLGFGVYSHAASTPAAAHDRPEAALEGPASPGLTRPPEGTDPSELTSTIELSESSTREWPSEPAFERARPLRRKTSSRAVRERPKAEPRVTTTESQAVPTASTADASVPLARDEDEEDLAYLRIVALLREARMDEARLAARGYLGKFPSGFRRPEVEGLVR